MLSVRWGWHRQAGHSEGSGIHYLLSYLKGQRTRQSRKTSFCNRNENQRVKWKTSINNCSFGYNPETYLCGLSMRTSVEIATQLTKLLSLAVCQHFSGNVMPVFPKEIYVYLIKQHFKNESSYEKNKVVLDHSKPIMAKSTKIIISQWK